MLRNERRQRPAFDLGNRFSSPPRPPADFAGELTGNHAGAAARFSETVLGVPTGGDNDNAFRDACGLPSRNGRAKKFSNDIS